MDQRPHFICCSPEQIFLRVKADGRDAIFVSSEAAGELQLVELVATWSSFILVLHHFKSDDYVIQRNYNIIRSQNFVSISNNWINQARPCGKRRGDVLYGENVEKACVEGFHHAV